jgi:hypothetical protein
MENVKVVECGIGAIVSNWGTYGGVPALFIEPAKEHGTVGKNADSGHDPENLKEGAVVIRFNNPLGAYVLIQDMLSAMSSGALAPNSKPAEG